MYQDRLRHGDQVPGRLQPLLHPHPARLRHEVTSAPRQSGLYQVNFKSLRISGNHRHWLKYPPPSLLLILNLMFRAEYNPWVRQFFNCCAADLPTYEEGASKQTIQNSMVLFSSVYVTVLIGLCDTYLEWQINGLSLIQWLFSVKLILQLIFLYIIMLSNEKLG